MLLRKESIFLFCFLVWRTGCANVEAQQPLTMIFNGSFFLKTGVVENKAITEASGITASYRNPNLLWMVNDGGNGPVLYAVSEKGEDLGEVLVEDSINVDWEDLASVIIKGISYLLIADVGDNSARREFCTIYAVKEPDILEGKLSNRFSVKSAWRILFRYEDGPQDCESIAADVKNQRILLLSKRTRPPVLYYLPLIPSPSDSSHVLIARKLTDVPAIQERKKQDTNTTSLWERYRAMPTAMDISPDGTSMAVLTYEEILFFNRRPQQSWRAAIHGCPKRIPIPRLPQAEALCFGADGKTIYLTSEKLRQPILRLNLKH